LQGVGALFLSRFLPLGLLRRFLVRPDIFLRFLTIYRTFDRIAAREKVLVYHSLFAYCMGTGPLLGIAEISYLSWAQPFPAAAHQTEIPSYSPFSS